MNPAGLRLDLLTTTALATCAKAVPRRGQTAILNTRHCPTCFNRGIADYGTRTVTFFHGQAWAVCAHGHRVLCEVDREPLTLGGYIAPERLRFGMAAP